jgi:hypothetical protein
MKVSNPWTCVTMMTAAVLTSFVLAADDIPWGKEKGTKTYPVIFKDRAKDRLLAEEAARQDAYRKLIERIYGMALNANTDVYDLTNVSRKLNARFQNELMGMKDIGARHYDDGRVEVAVKVTLREVIEKIETTRRTVTEDGRLIKDEDIRNVSEENRDKKIIAVGRSALKGTKGEGRVRAMRAAEIDCYARLAGRVFGMKINSDTTVGEFVLSDDHITSKICTTLLNGVKFTDYDFVDDGTCEAAGEIKIREVVEVLTRTCKRYYEGGKYKINEIANIERKNRDKLIKEVGKGVVRPGSRSSTAVDRHLKEQKSVIEKVLRKQIVVTGD